MIAPESFPNDPTATRTMLIDAVDAISETLAANAEESERSATLAPAAVDALDAAGLFRLQLPAVLGGAEVDPVVQMEVLEAVTAVDAASGWCMMIGATSIALLGAYLPDSGVARVFVDGHVPRAANSFFPAGVAVEEEGGYRVSGRWRFCSGVRHSDWISVGAVIQRTNEQGPVASGSPETFFVAVPVSEVVVHDNWNVVGLRGTGSCDITIADCFVPDDMTFQWDFSAPKPYRGGPLYRQAVLGFIAWSHIGFALGIARRALDELIHQVTRTKGAYRPSPLLERQVVHRQVGKFDLDLSAARMLAYESYRTVWQRLEADQSIDAATYAELQAIALYITDLATEIANSAFRYGGAGALYEPNIHERLLRDIQAAGQHIFVSDVNYEVHGTHVLGLIDD